MTYTLKDLTRLIAKRNFCILATQGKQGPHVAGVCYVAKGLDIFIPTSSKTTKVHNIVRDPHVAIHISVPWPLFPAPPRSIQFRATAKILPINDTDANIALAQASPVTRRVLRHLLDNVDTRRWGESVWINVRPVKRIETFMVGVPITTVFRDEEKALLHFDVPCVNDQATRCGPEHFPLQ